MALPNEEDNRVLTYLAKIAGKLVDLTSPRTRLEIFFAVWAGMDCALPPAPYTRFERFLLAAMGRGNLPSGCYTRLELFLNNIAGGVARLPDTDNSLLERYLREIAGGGLEIVYEGNLPTTIPGAIHELIRYGKCVQDGTPTPDAPVWPVINNGVTAVRHQSGLPLRYQLLSNLRASANVDVGVKTTKNTELEAAWTRITSATQYLYQSDSNPSGSTNTTAYITSGGNWRFGNRTASISPSQDKRYVSIQNSNGVSLNGELVASYATVGSFTSTNNLKVLGSGASLQIEYLKVRQSGVLVRDLVPVRDTVDGTYGFYDLVGGTFYTNANATFTPGAEVDDPIEVVAVGTPEVLTVDGANLLNAAPQTATVPDLYAVGDYKDEVDLVSGTVTRRVGVQLLTGEEEWRQLSGVKAYFTEISDMKVCNPVEAGFSTHFIGTAAATSSMPDGSIKLTYTSAPRGAISIRYNAAASTDDLKAYLAAQYAAGTPVIVLYPLATETTEEITPQPITSSGAVSSTTNAPPAEVKITYRG